MPAAAPAPQAVQVYGRKKTANAVATCKSGKGLIKVNGKPLEQIEPKASSSSSRNHCSLLARRNSPALISASALAVSI